MILMGTVAKHLIYKARLFNILAEMRRLNLKKIHYYSSDNISQ